MYAHGGGNDLADKLVQRKHDIIAQMGKLAEAEGYGKAEPMTLVSAEIVNPAPKTFKTKTEHVKHLLLKGTTNKEVLAATGWTNVSMPQQAAAAKLKLTITKKNGQNFYTGTPLNPDEVKAVKAGGKTIEKVGVQQVEIKTAPAPVSTPKVDVPNTLKTPATQAELEKAKKNTKLTAQYVPGAPAGNPEAEALITKFNEKYEGKPLSTNEELQQKVDDFKQLTAQMVPLQTAQQKIEAEAAAKSTAEAKAKNDALQAAAKAKADAEKAALEAKMNDPKIKAQYDKLHSIGVSDKKDLDKSYGQYIKKLADKGHTITGADAAYITAYRGNAYENLNASLWRGDKMDYKQSIYAAALKKALEKMPEYEGYAQRGVQTKGAFERYADNVGHVVTEMGFSSYGAKHKLWGEEAIIHLKATDLKDIRDFNPGEGGGELILQRGALLHIIKVDKKTREVWAEQIG